MAAKKSRKALARISEMYKRLDTDVEGDCQAEDLIVAEGNRITVSPTGGPCQKQFKNVRPRTIEEVRRWLGSPYDPGDDKCNNPCRRPELTNSLSSIADLESDDPAVRKKTQGLVRLAAREYVRGDVKSVLHWAGILDKFIELQNANLWIAYFADITVDHGAILHVSHATNALYANKITIIGSGQISHDGPITINCASIQGYATVRPISGITTPSVRGAA